MHFFVFISYYNLKFRSDVWTWTLEFYMLSLVRLDWTVSASFTKILNSFYRKIHKWWISIFRSSHLITYESINGSKVKCFFAPMLSSSGTEEYTFLNSISVYIWGQFFKINFLFLFCCFPVYGSEWSLVGCFLAHKDKNIWRLFLTAGGVSLEHKNISL